MGSILLKVPNAWVLSMGLISLIYCLMLYVIDVDEYYYTFHTIVIALLLCIYLRYIYRNAIKEKFVFSAAILVYYFFTQFGMCLVYYLINKSIEFEFGTDGAFYLYDMFYLKNISVAFLGFISTLIGVLLVKNCNFTLFSKQMLSKNVKLIDDRIGKIGIIFLVSTGVYFTYFLASGQISFGMDYSLYRDSGVLEGVYTWIIFFYMIGACFVCASQDNKIIKIGIVLFIYSAIILLGFGNRGEVLYPFLACFSIFVIRKGDMPKKGIMVSIIILFILIPFIKLFRHIGDMSITDLLQLYDSFNGIAEMGVSMRMTTYIMEELYYGSRDYLLGFSYISPFFNMLDHFVPFSTRLIPPESYNFTNEFYFLKSMTSVAESYANFGVVGVFFHHLFMGMLMEYLEKNSISAGKLAIAGAVCSVFIYSVRARIQSVPIEICICLFIYLFVKYIPNIKVKLYGNGGFNNNI